MTNRGRRIVGAAVLVLLAGCGVTPERDARALDPNAGPYRIVTQDRVLPPAGSHRISIFLVRNGALVLIPRRIPEQPTPAAVLTALSAGPSESEKSDGLTTGLPPGTDATVRLIDGGTVTVALPQPAEANSRSDAVLAFGQIVLSLTSLPTVTGVLFEQDGQPLQVPRADGSLSTAALRRVDYAALTHPG